MPKVNPQILRWARETAGLTLEEASQKLGISSPNRLVALETGDKEPTRPVLVKMAKQYHRPLLVFYMSEPPKKGNRGQDFRTLPENHPITSDALMDALLRDVQARQRIIRSALVDGDEAGKLPFVGSMKISDGTTAIVKSIKSTLNIDTADFHNQSTIADAFSLLRMRVELAGVFVLLIGDLGSYHTAIDLETFRGFALADDIAPFIVINDRDSQAAWSFTLIHELAHIWLGQTGISSTYAEKEVEKFCNKVAGEFFLTPEDFTSLNIKSVTNFEVLKTEISGFAKSRNLSSSMVAYNLLLIGAINQNTWSRLNNTYRDLWHQIKEEKRNKTREKEGGPNYYVVKRHRLGPNLINLVHRMMAEGSLTTTKAGKVLGVKARNVQKLIESASTTSSSQSA